MRRAAWLVAAAVTLGCRPEASCTTCVALTGVTLVDGTGASARAGQVVFIRDSLVAATGPVDSVPLPRGTDVRHLPGRWIMPGLVDAHAHVTFLRDPTDWTSFDRATSEQLLLILLAHGITAARNPAGPAREAVALRDDVRAGRVLGPALRVAGPPLNVAGGELSHDSLRSWVRSMGQSGVDDVKLYRRATPDVVRLVATLADSLGLGAIAHLEATDPATAVEGGLRAITHGASWSPRWLPRERRAAYAARQAAVGPMRARLDWIEWLDPEAPEVVRGIAAMAAAGVALDPTLVAYAPRLRGPGSVADRAAAARVTPAAVLATWEGALEEWTQEDRVRGGALWPRLLDLVHRYWLAGIPLLAGSDLPNAWVPPGLSLHEELALLVEAGIPPAAVITIATRNGATALGWEATRGAARPGMRADLVVLTADPLADIRNTRAIETVWLAGTPYRPDSLLAAAGVGEVAR